MGLVATSVLSGSTYTNVQTEDAQALADAGYDDLGGYTVFYAVPEPSTWALFGGLSALGLAVHRRRKG